MDKVEAMREGGGKLREIKRKLEEYAGVGRALIEVNDLAEKLITEAGAEANFSKVPGYHWATCINLNEGIVHGIPDETKIAEGDLVSIDLGLEWRGWNLDTSISFVAGQSTEEKDNFLRVGKHALERAVRVVRVGGSVYDISRQIEKTIRRAGYDPTYQLTGHFIGRKLHENPMIPCVAMKADRRHVLKENDTLAIEVMYALGKCDLVEAEDGWTYYTRDHSLTGLFEDTVLVTAEGSEVLS
jgi:methionyl aminopeptidase